MMKPFTLRQPKFRAAVLIAGVLLSISAATCYAKDEPTPLVVDASFNGASRATTGLTVTDVNALKGIKRAAVPLFAVEFILAESVTAQTSGFASAGRASATSSYRLMGVGEPDFQAITNAFYASFLSDLKASGIEIVDTAKFTAAPTYSKLMASASPAPIKSDSSMMMAPPGLSLYGFAKVGGGAKSKALFSALADMGSGFSAVGAAIDTVAFAAEIEASVIEVRMRVNFAQLTDNNKGFLGRLSSTASTSSKVFPSVDNVLMSVQTGQLRTAVTMNHILTLDSAAFAEVRDKPTTKGDVAGGIAVALFSMAIGSKNTSSTEEKEVVADPAKFKEVVGGGLNAASSMFIARMKQER